MEPGDGAKTPSPKQPSRERPAAMSSIVNPRDVEAGYRVYTPLMLRAYDAFVLGFSNRWLWRCPTNQLLRLYQRNVGRRHLDIGVGTGYFLDKVEWPVAMPDITLLDLNMNCLDAASARIARFKPKSVLANALDPFPAMQPFELDRLVLSPSLPAGLIGAKGCSLRSSQASDEIRFAPFWRDHCRGHRPPEPRCATALSIYNRKGIFSNADSTLEALRFELDKQFDRVTASFVGSVALFEVAI